MNAVATRTMPLHEADLRERALAVPLEPVKWPALAERGIEVLVRRDDLVHEQLSGNKFYKLFYNLRAARAAGVSRLVTLGGAYSNHLHALAAAGHLYGFATHGLIRGERPEHLSPTLRDAEAFGMRLHFVSRSAYREGAPAELEQLRHRWGRFILLPEGGANELGCQGASLMGWALEQQLRGDYNAVCLACGTGSTLAGVSAGLPEGKTALGFSVLKGDGDLGARIALAVRAQASHNGTKGAAWRLISGYHGGGYGRRLPPALQAFWHRFEAQSGLSLDPVYTLKLFWGVEQQARQGYWPRGSRLVVLHTGGLQGRRGFSAQLPPSPRLGH